LNTFRIAFTVDGVVSGTTLDGGSFCKLITNPASNTGFQPIPPTYSMRTGKIKLNAGDNCATMVAVIDVEKETEIAELPAATLTALS
jgi:hypothetical protein